MRALRRYLGTTVLLSITAGVAVGCHHRERSGTDSASPKEAEAAEESHPKRGETASVTSLTEAELEGSRVARVEELMEARIAGVQVIRHSSGISVRIRGNSTILGSSEPLYVIDGMPVEAGPNGMIFLNPRDIARIEVLKDIGSTSLYGVRGANGVVVITTKRGK